MSEAVRVATVGAAGRAPVFQAALAAHPAYEVVEGIERADLAYIGGEPDLAELTALVEAGSHLLLDPEAVMPAAELSELARAVERAGVVAMPGLTARFHPAVIRAAAALARGDIGLPWALQGELVGTKGAARSVASGLQEALDVVHTLLGLEPAAVAAMGRADTGGPTELVVLSLTVAYAVPVSLTVGSIEATTHAQGATGEHRYRVMGSEGILIADTAHPAVLVNGGVRTRPFGATATTALLDHLEACIRGRAETRLNLGDAVRVAAVAEASRTAARDHTTVILQPEGA